MGILRYNKLIKESVEELEQLLKKERDVRIYRRIQVIYLLKKTPNVQLKDISERMGISIQSAKKYWGETYHKFCVYEIIANKYHSSTPNSNFEIKI